jgi:hypothetical protein
MGPIILIFSSSASITDSIATCTSVSYCRLQILSCCPDFLRTSNIALFTFSLWNTLESYRTALRIGAIAFGENQVLDANISKHFFVSRLLADTSIRYSFGRSLTSYRKAKSRLDNTRSSLILVFCHFHRSVGRRHKRSGAQENSVILPNVVHNYYVCTIYGVVFSSTSETDVCSMLNSCTLGISGTEILTTRLTYDDYVCGMYHWYKFVRTAY